MTSKPRPPEEQRFAEALAAYRTAQDRFQTLRDAFAARRVKPERLHALAAELHAAADAYEAAAAELHAAEGDFLRAFRAELERRARDGDAAPPG